MKEGVSGFRLVPLLPWKPEKRGGVHHVLQEEWGGLHEQLKVVCGIRTRVFLGLLPHTRSKQDDVISPTAWVLNVGCTIVKSYSSNMIELVDESTTVDVQGFEDL